MQADLRITRARARECYEILERLYQEQAARGERNAYLADHGRPDVIKHHVNVFCWYAPYLPVGGKVLDWGCQHGPDSCLLRNVLGERMTLHACDFFAESEFQAFRRYASPHFTRLTGNIDLPYPENSFDAVIGSGVLEHTAMDAESLKAVYRVLQPGGVLVISYLPYSWSREEWQRRCRNQEGFHRRLYGRAEIRRLLKSFGFYPLDIRFQTFVPNVVDGKSSRWIKRCVAWLRYPFFAHSVLCCVARKMVVM